ncbi:hypothetical protein EGH82_22780 [Vibrio ponticus]|uniref:Uncharacterized protein n=1 Tax=Vibrio ponticus TaxID=265668 RepID=A0A3N3DTH1_9VIBR|nr:hypothetical protein [Vibrio ponticus]ROV57498.1 hypothetical protein EGH82_22780 [Vibrio ponticus]
MVGIISKAYVQGKTLFFSTLALLENAGVSLVPETEALNQSELCEWDECDQFALQWAQLWQQVIVATPCHAPVFNFQKLLRKSAQNQAIAMFLVAGTKQRICAEHGSSIWQMLACQRQLGDPDHALFSTFARILCLSKSFPRSNTLTFSSIYPILKSVSNAERFRFVIPSNKPPP